jgi:NTP pyrophosphatase (non-canonical NTP hydrolase)
MAKDGIRSGDDIDEKIGHELADCLWCVLVLAGKYNVDIEKSFLQTMDKLEENILNNTQ